MTGVVVRSLGVQLSASAHLLVSDVEFAIAPGEVMGLVGESGSGKTTVSLAMLGYARKGTRIAPGSRITIDGTDILNLAPAALRAARGSLVAYVPQDPSASLNPAITIGEQLIEGLTTGSSATGREDARAHIARILAEVSLPATHSFLARYPSQLSGGQQQRVVIAMAVAGHARLIVLDEPTTGLDASTQTEVLHMVSRLCATYRIAAIYVSHDLAVISHVADHVAVLYAGRIVERSGRDRLFGSPAHPYTRALLRSSPSITQRRYLMAIPGQAPSIDMRSRGCAFRTRCDFADEKCLIEPKLAPVDQDGDDSVRCFHPRTGPLIAPGAASPTLRARAPETAPALSVAALSASYGYRIILRDISFDIVSGECLAVVGESGSGKSTLSRCIVGLHHRWTGRMTLHGTPLENSSARRSNDVRRRIQYIFQNPYGSLNPRRTVGASIAVAVEHFFGGRQAEVESRVATVLERVGLHSDFAHRFPNELSGGEKQRAAIARALVCNPNILVCDEVTSALDVSVQAAIVELLRSLMTDGLGLIFVTHNLAVVRSLADRIAVLNAGGIVELAATERVLAQPEADYTRHLLSHTLDLRPARASAEHPLLVL
ncbi:peptide/nickel transport system ATP-binding protein [Rhizobiales bacterium GAS113]|nr:peptide/nickel transport system ATP-binding protein [Rhizobiales bacterium GAS113]